MWTGDGGVSILRQENRKARAASFIDYDRKLVSGKSGAFSWPEPHSAKGACSETPSVGSWERQVLG